MFDRLSDREVIGVYWVHYFHALTLLSVFIHDSISFSSSSFFISWIERITSSFSLVLKDVRFKWQLNFTPVRRNTYEFSFKRFNAILVSKSFWSFLSICFKWVRTSIARSFLADEFAWSMNPLSLYVIIPAARCSSNVRKYCSCCLFSLFLAAGSDGLPCFMLLYRSFKASFLVSAGKRGSNHHFVLNRRKTWSFYLYYSEYEMRLTVRKTRVRIQIIEKRREWSIMAKISQDGRKQHY